MGGHSGGEVASAMAVEVLEECLLAENAIQKSPREIIQHGYEEASRRIFDKASNKVKENKTEKS